MAVVEVPKVEIEKIGLRPFHEFDQPGLGELVAGRLPFLAGSDLVLRHFVFLPSI